MRVEVELGKARRVVIDDAVLEPHRAALAAAPEGKPTRLAYAAAHVVMAESYRGLDRPMSSEELAEHLDWEATMRCRRRLDAFGFGVAEAMDTAQRFQIGWPVARRLIEQCGALGLDNGFVAGAGSDHVEVDGKPSLIDAVVAQARFIHGCGGDVILLPMPWLAAHTNDPDDYVEVYGEIIGQLEGPVYVHWLGEMFAPELRGYFPGDSFDRVLAHDPTVVRGAKISLLDAAVEHRLRAALLPSDQILLTGDDLDFARLIAGGDPGDASRPLVAPDRWTAIGARDVALGDFSHALLGVLDGVAEPASLALRFLSRGDADAYFDLMDPAQRLSRAIFEAPTQHYKAGLAFLSWLNGQQDNAMLVGRTDRARDRDHYLRLAELAAKAGVLGDAETAGVRLREFVAQPR